MDIDTYKKLKDVPPGAIIQVWGHSWFGNLIRWYQGWQTGVSNLPNHSAIYIGSGDNSIIEANLKVELTRINKYFNDRHKVSALIFKEMTVGQLQVIKSNAYSSLGKPYDWRGILAFISKNFSESKYANYCSELVARCYMWARINISGTPWPDNPANSPKISPGDIYLWTIKNEQWYIRDIWTGQDWKK